MELSRVEMVIGPKAVEKLNAARVAVIGLGGVGSYVAEALCRTGVGSFVIMDNDTVEASNINRQLPALTSTICGAYTSASATTFNGFSKANFVVWEDVKETLMAPQLLKAQ